MNESDELMSENEAEELGPGSTELCPWEPEEKGIGVVGVKTPLTWPQHQYAHCPAEVASWQLSCLAMAVRRLAGRPQVRQGIPGHHSPRPASENRRLVLPSCVE